MIGQPAVLRIPEGAPEMMEISIKPEVIVAGDHPAALLIAEHLGDMGISVTLMIPFAELSEIMSPYRLLLTVDEAVSRRFAGLLDRVSGHPSITIMPKARPREIDGWWGNFTLRTLVGEEVSELHTSGIALAYRGRPTASGLGTPEGQITFSEFLNELDPQRGALKEGNPLRRIVFLLDGDRRDEKWASVTAVRAALYLKRQCGTQAFILCRELKVSVDVMEQDYRKARESGIMIFKYKDMPRIEKGPEGLEVSFEDAAAVTSKGPSEVTLEGLDTVVVQNEWETLPVDLLRSLRIPVEDGFSGPINPQFTGRTPKRGVVIAGDTWFPEYLTDAADTALSAAQELYKWVGKGVYRVDTLRVAEVDPGKCATCLTCYRICPHDSIRIERYGQRNVYITRGAKEGPTWEAARVKVETCNGCGLCASECPAKAIQLIYYPDLEVMEFLERNL